MWGNMRASKQTGKKGSLHFPEGKKNEPYLVGCRDSIMFWEVFRPTLVLVNGDALKI